MQTEEAVKNAARILNAGGVAVIPTDTVYGIAAHPAHPEAIRRLQTIKGRPSGKPIALLVADMAAVRAFGAVFPPGAERLAERYWPGALTLVLPCGDGYEGFRVPDFPLTRRLLALCGGALRVTSANVSGGQPALSAAQSLRDVGLEADLVVDGGIAPGGTASTVVKFDPSGRYTVLREGPAAVKIED
ncbi:MAG: Sua5/YciO/YrdC/YwlC family protein [Kiritimatiellae bacterium]|nr:Sua5/YciO/YrdC/YwlC family protein [Kiritimatiellia bacterium]